jgi:hypothetical protein
MDLLAFLISCGDDIVPRSVIFRCITEYGINLLLLNQGSVPGL